jgi:hypothetical protein
LQVLASHTGADCREKKARTTTKDHGPVKLPK